MLRQQGGSSPVPDNGYNSNTIQVLLLPKPMQHCSSMLAQP